MFLKYANLIKDFCRTHKKYVIPIFIFLLGIIVCLFVYFTSVRSAEPPSRYGIVADEHFLTFYYLFISIPLVIFFPILWYLLFVKKLKKQNIFAISALVFGCLYLFVFPPYSNFDEITHVPTTFYYSNMILGEEHSREGHFRTFQRRVEDVETGFLHNVPTDSYHYFHIARNFFRLASSPETEEAVAERIGPLYQYLPQALGVSIARLLNLGQVPTLFFGRFFSLIAFIAIMYFAIKKVPFKALFCLLGLAPNFLLTAGSFNYDTMINALCFFFIAYIFYLAYSRQQLRKRDYVLLIIIGALIAPLKYIYIPLLLLPLIIPRESYYKFRGAKALFCALLLVFGMLSTFIFQGITLLGIARGSLEVGSTVIEFRFGDEVYTIGFLARNPLILFRLLSVTLLSRLFHPIVSISSVPYLHLPIWISFVIFCFFVISIMPVGSEKPFTVTLRQKIIILFCAFSVYLLGHVAALAWTYVGAYTIRGAQARYFIPILPLLVVPLHTMFRRVKNYDSSLIFATALINGYSIIYIFQRAIFT